MDFKMFRADSESTGGSVGNCNLFSQGTKIRPLTTLNSQRTLDILGEFTQTPKI